MTVTIVPTITVSNEQTHSDAVAATPCRVIPFEPEQWAGSFNLFGLQARVLAAPLPGSREAKKAGRIAQRWRKAQAAMLKGLMPEPAPEDALKIVQAASDEFFSRVYPGKPKVKLQGQVADRFDPGAKFMAAIETASHVLFRPDAADRFPDVEGIERLAHDLLEFHARHHDGANARFMPVNAMGQCLQTLASFLRRAD